MNKKFFILIFSLTLFSFSSKNSVHKNNAITFSEDTSSINYNPASLFNLSMRKGEWIFTSDNKFQYSHFSIGYYLFKSYIFSNLTPTSFNFALGLSKINSKEMFQTSLGGTLLKNFRYGFTFNWTKVVNEKYLNMNTGLLINLFECLDFGITFFNIIKDNFYSVSSLKFDLTEDFHLGMGFEFKDFKKIEDYSISSEINLVKNFWIAMGYHKKAITFGVGLNFLYNTENLFLSFEYNRETKKYNRGIISYQHKFDNPFYSEYESKKETKFEKRKEVKKKKDEQEILKLQEEYLRLVQMYYKNKRYDDALDTIDKILELDQTTIYAQKAKKLKETIKNLLQE